MLRCMECSVLRCMECSVLRCMECSVLRCMECSVLRCMECSVLRCMDTSARESSLNLINRIYCRSLMQTEKSQPKGEWIMPEIRFTVFPALSIELRAGISWSASEIDVWLFFLLLTLKICRIMTFS